MLTALDTFNYEDLTLAGGGAEAIQVPVTNTNVKAMADAIIALNAKVNEIAAGTQPTIPVTTVAAAGSAQGDAAALSEGFNLVTGPDDTKGVILPAAAAGKRVIIKVGDGADLKVYPATGDQINAIAVNSALTVVDDVCFELIALNATTWYTCPLLPS